jgi:hypothetical protein
MINGASSEKKQNLLSKVKRTAKTKGLRYVVNSGIQKARNKYTIYVKIPFWFNYYKLLKSHRTFVFKLEKYKYFYHKYNTTWHNERTVEIPIVWHIVENEKGKILEVGNVLSHYFTVNYDIVDKYEKAERVLNKDVTEIDLSEHYDLIVSISTLEHVGWDENPTDKEKLNDSEKTLLAIENLKRLLKPKGKIIVTAPLGYNPHLDHLVKSGKIGFTSQYFLKRISKNRWVETDWDCVKDSKFNSPYPFANALVVGMIEN